MFEIFLNGMILSFGLIIAIGAQNIFVLSQGLAKNHIFAVCLVCFICDCLLMACGVFGVGEIFGKNKYFAFWLGIGGVLFLLFYALSAFISVFRGSRIAKIQNAKSKTLKKTIFQTLAITLLNPHVYLDTVIIIGSIGAILSVSEKIYFWFGNITASFVWFFALGYASTLLSRFFTNPKAWKIIDFLIGIFMLYMAWILFKFIQI